MGRVSSFPGRLKKRLSGLSGHFGHESHSPADLDSGPPGAPREEEETLPAPSASFPSLLSRDKSTATRELVRPYLRYETALRKAFAEGATGIADDANLVPVYNGDEKLFTIRDVDRKKGDSKKYLLPLEDRERESDRELAISPSLDEYTKDFDAFTHGWLTRIV